MVSCNSVEVSSLPTPENDQISVCDCIKSTKTSVDPNSELDAIMNCILSETKNDKDSFFILLASTINNCNGFSKKISELSLSIAGYDTIQFSTPTPKGCQSKLIGKWKDVLSDEIGYSMFYENRVEHYKADTLVGKWQILFEENCQVTYLVTEQSEVSPFPPNLGDTVISTTIGVKDKYVKNLLQINEIEIVTIGVKLEK